MTEHEHGHDHSHTMMCRVGCLFCVQNQPQIKGEIEALEEHLRQMLTLFDEMGTRQKGNISPALEALLGLLRDRNQEVMQEYMEAGADPFEAVVEAFNGIVITSVILGMVMERNGFDFTKDLYSHPYVEAQKADLN